MSLGEKNAWEEYDSAAVWCAERKVKGTLEGPLPEMSAEAYGLIEEDPEAFEEHVKNTAYALAMEKVSDS